MSAKGEITGLVYLPLKRIKGFIHTKIKQGNFQIDNFPELNDASIAVMLEFHDNKLLLTGDSTSSQWFEHKLQLSKNNITNLNISLLKVPHHGSKENNSKEIYKYFFGNNHDGKCIFISANGKSHPHNELFNIIRDYDLRPYCTNLASQCTTQNIYDFETYKKIPKEMRTFLTHYSKESEIIPCQGDIILRIDSSGVEINNSTNMPCVYR